MKNIGRALFCSCILLLLLGTFTNSVGEQGRKEPNVEGAVTGGEIGGSIQLAGRVLCVGCTYDEARRTYPNEHPKTLYELKHGNARAVMKLELVNNAARWDHLVLSSPVEVRGEDSLWQELTAAANQPKRVQLTGHIHSMRLLEISKVIVMDGPEKGGEPAGAEIRTKEDNSPPQTIEPKKQGKGRG